MKVSFEIPHPKDVMILVMTATGSGVDPRHIKLHNMFKLFSFLIQYFLCVTSDFVNAFLFPSAAS